MSRTGPTWQPPELVVRNKFRWALFSAPIVVSSFVWSTLSSSQGAHPLLRLAFGLAAVGPLVGHALNWRNGIAVGKSGVEVRTELLRRQRRTWEHVESFELRTDRGRWRIVVLLVDEPPMTTTGAAVLNPDGRWGTRMVRRLEAFRLSATSPEVSA
ncbi:MAG: hypothetical protein ABMA25_08740 [Ilumatobacteraceae bacterium]